MKSPWLKYESRLADWMKQFASEKLSFTNGFQAIPGFPSNGFRADGLLTDGNVVIALEVEVKQTHPDTNVGKYWLLSQYQAYEKVILFHVYTPEYTSYPWRLQLGQFYASKMAIELPFEYELVDQREAIDTNSSFEAVTRILEQRILGEFGVIAGKSQNA
ncbi:hypothetical protein PSEHALCIP103_03647 [Pseudoalteromonas haloplanktis]|uniref:Uncharacterized protein n=2 Tax=Pseudoalteromonas TaxID=53246 RepID=A0A9W4R4Z5_PSEHA|nr:hypothetical protein [Pseudoalteromonas sp.]KZY43212.1 hypothetical protein A3733_18215 [Pseudoalteromonas shioyasakiensis]MAJ38916.1 hypothetical protein [Pseudoalteromonadaceae bacterium]TMO38483.1 hypothetical protein CWC25_21805 [Pseudoalteromonas sp. S4389]CAH9066732.1 hypothetical protein PSEHALCIP103_03647 [Pseudoalteromonas haloplanktis]NRA81567.1 hypothetical protein [Pseudoalteromonas sp.]